jgi:ribosomal protein S18 acetylase RimI-like enzyme
VIRPAAPDDARRLAALMPEFYAAEGLSYSPAVAAAVEALLGDPGLGRAWLIEAGDADVGYLVLTWGYSLEFGGRIGVVDELYVREGYRGAGLGGRALEAASAACRAAGAAAVRLEVDHANEAAARLYQRSGYIRHERHIMTLLHG